MVGRYNKKAFCDIPMKTSKVLHIQTRARYLEEANVASDWAFALSLDADVLLFSSTKRSFKSCGGRHPAWGAESNAAIGALDTLYGRRLGTSLSCQSGHERRRPLVDTFTCRHALTSISRFVANSSQDEMGQMRPNCAVVENSNRR